MQTPSVPPTRIEHHRLSNITIDVKTVMKSGKKAQPVQKDADHTHVKTEALEQNKKVRVAHLDMLYNYINVNATAS